MSALIPRHSRNLFSLASLLALILLAPPAGSAPQPVHDPRGESLRRALATPADAGAWLRGRWAPRARAARDLARVSPGGDAAPPLPTATASGTVSDLTGGFYVAWTDFGLAGWLGAPYEVLVQHYTATGDVAGGWPAGGLKAADAAALTTDPILTSDGSGGVIVAWNTYGYGPPVPTAQRISSAGTRLWAAAGVPLGGAAHFCQVFDILSDEAGGAYVSWEDSGTDLAPQQRALIQHVSNTGSVVAGWPGGGLDVTSTVGPAMRPRLFRDGSGGVITVWDYGVGFSGQRISSSAVMSWNAPAGILFTDPAPDAVVSGDEEGGLFFAWAPYLGATGFDIMVQHYNGAGTAVLAPGGRVVCNDYGNQLNPQIVSDGTGGALIAWRDDRDGLGYLTIFCLRIDGSGNDSAGWPANGVVASNSDPYTYALLQDGAHGAFISWNVVAGYPGPIYLNVQHVTAAGTQPAGWPLDGIRLNDVGSLPDAGSFSCTLNSSGGVHATWVDGRASVTSRDLYGRSVDGSGNAMAGWGSIPKPLRTELGRRTSPAFALDGGGGPAIRWQDKRSGAWEVWGSSITSTGLSSSPSVKYSLGTNDVVGPDIVGDGAGGTISTWNAYNGSVWDVYAQRVGAGGSPLWTEGGVLLIAGISPSLSGQRPQILVSDGSGGAIAGQTSTYGSGLVLQRVDSNGNALWPAGVNPNTSGYGPFSLVPDGAHGVLCSFDAFVYDSSTVNYYNDLYVNRVDASGNLPWGEEGKRVASTYANRSWPIGTSDGSGGMFLCWAEGTFAGDDASLHVQHLDAAGNLATGWPADGVQIKSAGFGPAYPTAIVADGSGGVVAGWWDGRGGSIQAYAQAVDGSATVLWTANGVALTTGSTDQLLADLCAGPGGVIGLWSDARGSSWDLYAQKLNAAGVRQWGSGGLLLCGANDTQGNAILRSDGSGGAFVVWQDARNRPNDAIYAQHVASAGSVDWTSNGVVSVLATLVSASADAGLAHLEWRVAPLAAVAIERSDDGVSWTSRGSLVADGEGRVIYEDSAVEAGRRYGWRLAIGDARAGEAWLTVPGGLSLALSGAWPNPAADRLSISFVLPERTSARLELIDVAGRRVQTREVGSLGPGRHRLDLDAGALAPGIYHMRLTQSGRSVIARVALLR